MKTKENVTLYECDFCKKKMQRKHSMENHEIRCAKNPANVPKCYDCENCEKVPIRYERNGGDILEKGSAFVCNVQKDFFMFPPSIGFRGGPPYSEYHGEEIEQNPMPMECDKFKSFIHNDFEGIPNPFGLK